MGMRPTSFRSLLLGMSVLLGCTYPHATDSGVMDTGRRDTGPMIDSGPPDTNPMDGGSDVGPIDVGPPDTGDDVGMDAGYQLYHGWVSPIAGCLTDSFNTTTATALGGAYPYNAGANAACRAWKLAATVCTTEPVMYIDTTNWMCPTSGGFTDPMFGTYCPAANQFSCSTCPGACNAGMTCAHNPLSLRNCMGLETTQN